MASIPRQYLITMYHELSNKMCSLISCMDSANIISEMEKKESKTLKEITYALEYMKRITKIFVLIHNVCFDVIEQKYSKIASEKNKENQKIHRFLIEDNPEAKINLFEVFSEYYFAI